jgi:hypothetical protein
VNPDIKTLWVNALRSGEYTKGHGQLFEKGRHEDPDRHCALGVLAEEAGKAGVLTIDPLALDHTRFGPIDNHFYIPSAVAEWAGGLAADDQQEVVTKNDRRDWSGEEPTRTTFEEMADYIEENL